LPDGFPCICLQPILSVISRVLNSGEPLTSIFLASCARLSSNLCITRYYYYSDYCYFKFFHLPSYGRLSFRLCITRLTALINTVLSILDTVKYIKICVYSSLSASVLRDGFICILRDVLQSIPYRKLCNSNVIQTHISRKTPITDFPLRY